MFLLDYLIDIAIWIFKTTMLGVLPNEYSFFTLPQFVGTLNGFKTLLLFSFRAINTFIPLWLVLILFAIILSAEVYLFWFKAGRFVINLIFRAGA